MLHLVVWRGNNGQAVFRDVADRQDFLGLLAEASVAEGLAVHAYVLLEAEVRLLVTPAQATSLSRGMQALGRAYVRRHNRRHGRTGTLWEGRYGSTVLQAERYLWWCMACMDQAPVRAGMVQAVEAYPWSSHAHYTGRRQERWLTMPPLYWDLGNTPFAREAAYAERVRDGVDERVCVDMVDAARHGWALGDAAFVSALQEATGRRLVKGRAGRPAKTGRASGSPITPN